MENDLLKTGRDKKLAQDVIDIANGAAPKSWPDAFQSALLAGQWIETCFRRFSFKMAEAGGSPPYRKILSKQAVALHHELRYDLWRASDTKLNLLLGVPSYAWHKKYVGNVRSIPFSDTKIFEKRAALRVELDAKGEIVRLALPVYHPTNFFIPRLQSDYEDLAKLQDQYWNFVLACAGVDNYNVDYFEYKFSQVSHDEIDAAPLVDWG
jgi:hypothetical protein